MWRSLSIRTQLTLLMLTLLLLVQLPTIGLINWFDAKERQILASEQARTLARSLNNDLLQAIANPVVEIFTDLNFRISGYKPVDAVRVLNEKEEPIFEYSKEHYSDLLNELALAVNEVRFDGQHLFLKLPIEADNHVFGYAVILIDPHQYETQIEDRFATLLWITPLEFLLGWLLAWRLSLNFTHPFNYLAQVMERQDVSKEGFERVDTQAENEVKTLFDGYNQMMMRIVQTTEEMRFMSKHDALTGLYNRYAIDQEVLHLLQSEVDPDHVLLKLDLDQFKLVNDGHGHEAGDDLLKRVAQSMVDLVANRGCIARIGGDDFLVLLPHTSTTTGRDLAKQLLVLLRDYRFIWQGEAMSVSASLGLVSFKSFQFTLAELMRAADAAFYLAKATGRNQLHEYSVNDQSLKQLDRDVHMARYIKEALNDGPSRFELYAQPIVALQAESNEIGYEILLRLWDSEGRFVSPVDFLPTAERYQLMTDIDRYVLWTYLSSVSEHGAHLDKLHVAHVNLAGASLNHPDFQQTLRTAVAKFSFPWRKLALEVTETSAVGNFTKAIDFIKYCHHVGISFALDDFGTGMSSFEYLKHLPFNVIKIDGSFIKDMHKDPLDLAVIRYIHEISVLRQQETVAEYVETAEDVAVLRQIGITYGQGYFLGKPKPLDEWLMERA